MRVGRLLVFVGPNLAIDQGAWGDRFRTPARGRSQVFAQGAAPHWFLSLCNGVKIKALRQ